MAPPLCRCAAGQARMEPRLAAPGLLAKWRSRSEHARPATVACVAGHSTGPASGCRGSNASGIACFRGLRSRALLFVCRQASKSRSRKISKKHRQEFLSTDSGSPTARSMLARQTTQRHALPRPLVSPLASPRGHRGVSALPRHCSDSQAKSWFKAAVEAVSVAAAVGCAPEARSPQQCALLRKVVRGVSFFENAGEDGIRMLSQRLGPCAAWRDASRAAPRPPWPKRARTFQHASLWSGPASRVPFATRDRPPGSAGRGKHHHGG